jgi:hypothetical protein
MSTTLYIPLYVRDLEDVGRPIIGRFIDVQEDIVRYWRVDGTIGRAPADCVDLVTVAMSRGYRIAGSKS